MNKKLTTGLVALFSLIAISSVMLGILQPWDSKDIDIKFTHSEILTYPGQTTWIIAEVISITDSSTEISIDVNQTIEMDYVIHSSQNKIIEIFLYPNITHLNLDIKVTITAISIKEVQESIIIKVVDWSSSLPTEVEEIIQCFSTYFIENLTFFTQAENDSLEFMGNIPQILVVSHYLFKSNNFELTLARHVTIAPHDWVQVYLRSRDSFLPNYAFKIDSWSSTNHSIYEINPPDNISR
jgi:hypothetical protein